LDDVGYTYMAKSYTVVMQGVGLRISQLFVVQNNLD